MKYVIGIYCKPGFLKVAMYDARGHYLHFWEENCKDTSPEYITGKIAEGINYLVDLRRSSIENVIGAGITLEGCIVNWLEVPFRETVQERLGKPVFIDDLTNCLALAEMWQGAGWGKKDMLFVDWAGPLQVRVIRDKKLDRSFAYLNSGLVCDGQEKSVDALWPILGPLVADIKPETVIVNGMGKIEDSEFWLELNKSWQCHAVGQEVPELLPAELGAEAFTIGAAALVLFR
jgi:predicted NBD/HSP70 family sugar kinase